MNGQVVLPNGGSVEGFDFDQRALAPFCDEVVDFIDHVSRTILSDARCKLFPELIALAFWMRKARITQLQKAFFKSYGERCMLGRGLVFHLAPSNVDTIFAYSWFLSMLVGNANILRISDKHNEQLGLLLDLIATVLSEERHAAVHDRILVVRYGHDDEITAHFSARCDMRVIWGGDATVQHIRSIPVKPTAKELAFADKFSFAVIDVEKYIAGREHEKIAESFCRDAFTFSQLACSSPRLVVWIGSEEKAAVAQTTFWNHLERQVASTPPMVPPAGAMDKLVTECLMAVSNAVSLKNDQSGFINRVRIESLSVVNSKLHCGMGLFYEITLPSLGDITEFVDHKSQTLALYGFERQDVLAYLTQARPRGIDRIVPIGRALDFSEIWDGSDLLYEFCREITIDV